MRRVCVELHQTTSVLAGDSGFIAYSSTNRWQSRVRAGGFGKCHLRVTCTIAVMATPSQQARPYARRLRTTQRVQSRTARAESFARPAAALAEDTSLATPGALPLRRLANRLAAYAPHDGAFQLRLPGTWAIRLSRMTTEAAYATMGPALCIAAQGAKVVMLGREVLEYDPAHLLVFAVDLPVSSQVTRASRKDPYLGFVLELDPARVAELAARVYSAWRSQGV